MIHHHAVPEFGVVVLELRVSCNLHPVVFQHILQCIIRSQGCKPSLPCKHFHTAAHDVVHAVLLKSQILFLENGEFSIYLEKKKFLLEVFKWKVVEFEDGEISSDEERILVGIQLLPCDFGVKKSQGFEGDPGDGNGE